MSDSTSTKKVAVKKATAPAAETPRKRGRPAGTGAGKRGPRKVTKGDIMINVSIPLKALMSMSKELVEELRKYL